MISTPSLTDTIDKCKAACKLAGPDCYAYSFLTTTCKLYNTGSTVIKGSGKAVEGKCYKDAN